MNESKIEPGTTASEGYIDNPDDWDEDSSIVMEGRPVTRTTFSVRMHPKELGEISGAARAANMKTGEFIRTAALAAARGGGLAGDPVKALIALAAEAGMRVSFEPASPRTEGETPASAAS